MKYTYSPLPRKSYHLHGMPQCEASEIGKLAKADAVWNLFWLSVPSIDAVPAANPNWAAHYAPIANAAFTITTDVLGDDVMYRKLGMHPKAFLEWFEREDMGLYDCHTLMGDAWRETVVQRAKAVVNRLALMSEPVMGRSSNVVYANFGRKMTRCSPHSS